MIDYPALTSPHSLIDQTSQAQHWLSPYVLTKHGIVPSALSTYAGIYIYCALEWKWRTPTLVENTPIMVEKLTTTILLKKNFPVQQLFLKYF